MFSLPRPDHPKSLYIREADTTGDCVFALLAGLWLNLTQGIAVRIGTGGKVESLGMGLGLVV